MPEDCLFLCGWLQALHHLHRHCVVHRDVKGNNILLTSSAQLKLIDFGMLYSTQRGTDIILSDNVRTVRVRYFSVRRPQ